MSSKQTILIIIADSFLFAGGILTVIIPSAIQNNWYWIVSVILFIGAFMFPLSCNAFSCSGANSNDMWLYDDDKEAEMGKALAWALVGISFTFAYAVPLLLWRTKVLLLSGMITTMVGGTAIIGALIIFVYLLLIPRNYI